MGWLKPAGWRLAASHFLGALALVSLNACIAGSPDLVREEKLEGETHSPAEQFRILSSGKHLTSDYFIERGQVEGTTLIGSDPEQAQKNEALQERVTRLEQQAAQAASEEGKPTTAAKDAPPTGQDVAKPVVKAGASIDAKTRLRLLRDLKDEKLITDDEYRSKVKEILEEL